ncbi:hypothetical protein LAZ67_2006320 [Cordylochernes scorpioides]|uniref:Uncharacterized protein n=1 Tax=Cordylochernes scorpioides TaxID=51811 RepID=A0ABY6K580_9ARAC|nr:hypothetical protein LAZ67_2006320 [Cordylochernes scorpioides]
MRPLVIHHRSGDLTTREGCLSPSQTILVLVGPGHPPQVRWLDYRKGISVSGSVLPRLKVASGSISTPRNHQRSGDLTTREGCLSPSQTILVLVGPGHPPQVRWLDYRKGISVSGSVLPRLKVASGSISTPRNHQRCARSSPVENHHSTKTAPSITNHIHTIFTGFYMIVAVHACGVDVEKGPIRQQLWNAPPCDNVESWFGAQSRMIPEPKPPCLTLDLKSTSNDGVPARRRRRRSPSTERRRRSPSTERRRRSPSTATTTTESQHGAATTESQHGDDDDGVPSTERRRRSPSTERRRRSPSTATTTTESQHGAATTESQHGDDDDGVPARSGDDGVPARRRRRRSPSTERRRRSPSTERRRRSPSTATTTTESQHGAATTESQHGDDDDGVPARSGDDGVPARSGDDGVPARRGGDGVPSLDKENPC